MRPSDLAGIAMRRLRGRLLESLLVMVGIAAAVGVMASTLSLYRTVSSSMGVGAELREITVRTRGDTLPRTGPVRRIEDQQGGGAVLLPEDIAAARSVAPSVALGYFGGLYAQNKSSRDVIGIVAGDFFAARGLHAAEGTLFSAADEADGARVTVLGAARARALFPSGGALGATVTMMGLEYTVVGVLAPFEGAGSDGPVPDDNAFVPVRSAVVFERMKSVPSLTFVARSSDTLPAAVQELRSYFDARFGPGAATVEARLDEIEAETGRVRGVLTVLMVFGAAGLVIAGVNVLNVLLARAARRTRETGIEMALGASRRTILALGMGEGMAIAALGSLLGLTLSLGFNVLLEMLFSADGGTPPRVLLTVPAVLVSVGGALALTVLLSMSPALRAARLAAADAIRTE
jgi:putative ABC transport system permease protein